MYEDRNYIRLDSFSLSSIEIYPFLFLLGLLVFVWLKEKQPADIKIIYLYTLALPFTDVVYRFAGVQVSEVIILLMIASWFLRRGMKINFNYLTLFMVFMVVVLMSSLIISNQTANDILFRLSSSERAFPYFYIMKFIFIIFLVNHIIISVKNKDEVSGILHYLRLGGNIAAGITLIQVVLFKLGFVVPGIFYMWDFPRAKGLAHEPGTNAFQLCMTLILTTFYFKDKLIRFHKKSFLIQLAAFFICFSTGGFIFMIVFAMLFGFNMLKRFRPTLENLVVVHILLAVFVIVGVFFVRSGDNMELLKKPYDKAVSIITDYSTNSNDSGRGADIIPAKLAMENNTYFGIGAFNTPVVYPENPNTNVYLMTFTEVGFVGISAILMGLLGVMAGVFQTSRKIKDHPSSLNMIIYIVTFLLAIAWLRVLFFPQVWLVLALIIAIERIYTSNESILEDRNNLAGTRITQRLQLP